MPGTTSAPFRTSSMRVLSIRQPSAWAICAGHKLIENRAWWTSYRGRLLIHAGRIVDQGAIDHLHALGIEVPHDLITSAIIGSVVLDDIVPNEMVANNPFASGPWCWLLSSPGFLPAPVPMAGPAQDVRGRAGAGGRVKLVMPGRLIALALVLMLAACSGSARGCWRNTDPPPPDEGEVGTSPCTVHP